MSICSSQTGADWKIIDLQILCKHRCDFMRFSRVFWVSLKEIFAIYWEGVCRIKTLAAGFSGTEAVGVGGG